MGPDSVGDEFDEIDEEEPSDPETIYATVSVTEDRSLTIETLAGDMLTIQVDGDDVIITVTIPDDTDAISATEYPMVVPRSAFAEDLTSIGVLGADEPGAL